MTIEIGITTFADVALEGGVTPTQRIPQLLDEIALADQVGLDVIGIGEHHRRGYAAAAPPVILAASASRTKRIRLTTAVTVLSTDDPVRVFEQFTALDHVSEGRAEITVGRGAYPESFRLFAPDADYDSLFAEKLDLLLRLRQEQPVTWSGSSRPDLDEEVLYPRPAQAVIPLWVGVGGTPASAIRAGSLNLPMTLVALGGTFDRLEPLVNLHRSSLAEHGHPHQPIGLNLHGFVADTTQHALDIYGPADTAVMNDTFGGRPRAITLSDFLAKTTPTGVYAVGSPQQVIDKILLAHDLLGIERITLQMAVGTVPHLELMRAIELLGTIVAPAIKKELGFV